MHDDAARCVHVVVGKVRVRTLQAKHREQRLQLVLAQFGMQQSYKAKRVEIVGVRLVQVVLGCVAAQVMVEYVPVVVGIVSEQAASVGILHEHTECSVVREQRVMLALLDDGVDNVAKHGWYLAVGFYVHAKLGAGHDHAVAHLHGSNLKDIILKDIQSGGLRVEHHDGLLLVTAHKTLQVGGGGVLPVSLVCGRAQQVGRQDGTVEQSTHEVARRSIRLVHAHSLHEACPRKEVELVVEHSEMRKQQLQFGRRKEVGARHLEVPDTTACEFATDILCVAVGIDDERGGRLGEHCAETVGKLHAIAHLMLVGLAVEQRQLVAEQRGLQLQSGIGQQRRVDMQLFGCEGIEDVEQILRRAMVHREVMQLASRLLLECGERVELCAHEREDGLLLVAEEHHRAVGTCGEELYDS